MGYNYYNIHSDVFKFIVLNVVFDECFDGKDIDNIIDYCKNNGIKTESQFKNECIRDGNVLNEIVSKYDEMGYDEIQTYTDMPYNVALKIITDIGDGYYDNWDKYFSYHGTPKDISGLAVILLSAEYDSWGFDALVKEVYDYIKDDLN